MANWKIVAKGSDGPWELYDLGKDRCEAKDLAKLHPEKVRAMAATWKEQDERWQQQRQAAPATTKRMMPTITTALEEERSSQVHPRA